MTLDTYQHFPETYPDDFLSRIIEDGATRQNIENIYRISKTGACNRDVFICSALENNATDVNNRDAYLAKTETEYDVGEWSTSCWNDLNAAQEKLALMERHHNSPLILVGNILSKTGYSILTTERVSVQKLSGKKRNRKKHHVDWWIFKDQDVSQYFKILEV